MEPNWAAEHLQIIRTLMERTALYRRALAPTMLLAGTLGTIAAVAGWVMDYNLPLQFVWYWGLVCALALFGTALMVRRQALKDAEPFWSPPARRVIQAVAPAFFSAFVFSAVAALRWRHDPQVVWWLPAIWMLLHGCALNAAGFFMPRGIKLFGWGMIACGCALLAYLYCYTQEGLPLRWAHAVMGVVFGGGHLAYGIYLHFTGKTSNAA
jgi:hypothetical protein